jgi:glycerol-3-phosphate O-acyltransferase
MLLAFVAGPVLSLRRSPPQPPAPARTRAARPCRANARARRLVATATTRVGVPPVGTDFIAVPDGLTFTERAQRYAREGVVAPVTVATITGWFDSYTEAARRSVHVTADPVEYTEHMFSTLLELARRHVANPLDFSPYHEKVRTPFDYYKFGLEFATVLVDTNNSKVSGQENIWKAREQVANGDNVVFLANHQSEGDPYAIDILFDWMVGVDRQFCENLVFMAGDRVREDPVVAPFSIGRNLLTVYSKKHINDVPDLRGKKLQHNRRTIAATSTLFNEGGRCVWFAPSGGRDRRSAISGRVEISQFDADAVEMMRITAEKSSRPTHFYPMSLLTYDMLPPPASVGGAQLGEVRTCAYAPMNMHVAEEIDWSKAIPHHVGDKLERRRLRSEYVQGIIQDGYTLIGGDEH